MGKEATVGDDLAELRVACRVSRVPPTLARVNLLVSVKANNSNI